MTTLSSSSASSSSSLLSMAFRAKRQTTKNTKRHDDQRESNTNTKATASTVASGSVLDYAVEKCLDSDANVRCTKPFLVASSTCYKISWSTEGTLSHTTVEVRDAASSELVYYRDNDGEWTPEKNELVYLDFKPKVWKTGNDTVEYKVKTCE